jgi:predicted ABC-type ATPase
VNRLDLVAGPNGAGKSTFVELTLAPLLRQSAFVTADEIAQQRWPEDPSAHAYEAALIAEQTRQRLIGLGRPFIAEPCSRTL